MEMRRGRPYNGQESIGVQYSLKLGGGHFAFVICKEDCDEII
jgi:hypothetical protein